MVLAQNSGIVSSFRSTAYSHVSCIRMAGELYVSIFRNETPVSEQQPQSASSLGTEWLIVAKTSLA